MLAESFASLPKGDAQASTGSAQQNHTENCTYGDKRTGWALNNVAITQLASSSLKQKIDVRNSDYIGDKKKICT